MASKGTQRTPSKEAAYHEAGHVVAAYISKCHYGAPRSPVMAYPTGHGFAFISLNGTKCKAAGVPPNPSNVHVAGDLCVVLCAGFEAEVIALGMGHGLVPDALAANDDYARVRHALTGAGLPPDDIEPYKIEARNLLRAHWAAVDALAQKLYQRGAIGSFEAFDIVGDIIDGVPEEDEDPDE